MKKLPMTILVASIFIAMAGIAYIIFVSTIKPSYEVHFVLNGKEQGELEYYSSLEEARTGMLESDLYGFHFVDFYTDNTLTTIFTTTRKKDIDLYALFEYNEYPLLIQHLQEQNVAIKTQFTGSHFTLVTTTDDKVYLGEIPDLYVTDFTLYNPLVDITTLLQLQSGETVINAIDSNHMSGPNYMYILTSLGRLLTVDKYNNLIEIYPENTYVDIGYLDGSISDRNYVIGVLDDGQVEAYTKPVIVEGTTFTSSVVDITSLLTNYLNPGATITAIVPANDFVKTLYFYTSDNHVLSFMSLNIEDSSSSTIVRDITSIDITPSTIESINFYDVIHAVITTSSGSVYIDESTESLAPLLVFSPIGDEGAVKAFGLGNKLIVLTSKNRVLYYETNDFYAITTGYQGSANYDLSPFLNLQAGEYITNLEAKLGNSEYTVDQYDAILLTTNQNRVLASGNFLDGIVLNDVVNTDTDIFLDITDYLGLDTGVSLNSMSHNNYLFTLTTSANQLIYLNGYSTISMYHYGYLQIPFTVQDMVFYKRTLQSIFYTTDLTYNELLLECGPNTTGLYYDFLLRIPFDEDSLDRVIREYEGTNPVLLYIAETTN